MCSVFEKYVKFSDEQAGLKAMRSSHLGRKCETEIPDSNEEMISHSVHPLLILLSPVGSGEGLDRISVFKGG